MLAAASLAALIASGALAQEAAPEAGTETGPAAGETLLPAEEQVFNYSIIDEIVTLDPGLIEVVDDSHIARQLFEGLYNQDAEGNIRTGRRALARGERGRLTYTFHAAPRVQVVGRHAR
jgi:oligopeptide transport system substrate-binding protein